jgi:hypothetical protein
VAFQSILFETEGAALQAATDEPACFGDLNLDQVVAAITASKQEYNLKPFFYSPLRDESAVNYRHAVLRDLADKALIENLQVFAQGMRTMREYLEQADTLHHRYQKERWLLDAAGIYCDAVCKLAGHLAAAGLRSQGMLGFRQYITEYCTSSSFATLAAATERLQARLAQVRYCLLIKGSTIKVRKFEHETDYTGEVTTTFARFTQGPVRDYRVTFPSGPSMNHVETQILDAVALLFPDEFNELDRFCATNSSVGDGVIRRFDREIQFYLACLDTVAIFRRGGLPFCYPEVSTTSKETLVCDAYDLALAYKRLDKDEPVVCNDIVLQGQERILVISGPNQGGKTTYARACGQVHYLASLGCPIPARAARVFLCDAIYTHFESEENIANLRGKLADDLVRVHAILQHATPRSMIILNEIFASTTLRDAVLLGKKVMAAIAALDLLCVCVTFLDELALGATVVSMVSSVDPRNGVARTYQIVRRPADGRAYAVSIAEKHRLTYASLLERIKP